MIKELEKDGIILNTCSYKIWMMTQAKILELEKIENVLKEMKCDDKVNTYWTIYDGLANIYVKVGHLDNARFALKEMENKITQNDLSSYYCMINLYSRIGSNEEVYRIW